MWPAGWVDEMTKRSPPDRTIYAIMTGTA
jgi:hypothetical protein